MKYFSTYFMAFYFSSSKYNRLISVLGLLPLEDFETPFTAWPHLTYNKMKPWSIVPFKEDEVRGHVA
jgi:hypothetical protein